MVKTFCRGFFIFPADLIHMVYPFKSEGERRSFSMNIEVHQEKLDKDGKPIQIPKAKRRTCCRQF